jgi:hypothetical protein
MTYVCCGQQMDRAGTGSHSQGDGTHEVGAKGWVTKHASQADGRVKV